MDTTKIATRQLSAEITGTASGTLQVTITDDSDRTVGVLVLSPKISKNTGSLMFWGQGQVVVAGAPCSAQGQVVVNNTKGTAVTAEDAPETSDGEMVGVLSCNIRTSAKTGSAMWWGQSAVVVGGTPCSAQVQVVINHSKDADNPNSRRNGPAVKVTA